MMRFFAIIVTIASLTFALRLTTESPSNGHCIWYGQCGPYGLSDRYINCYDTGPARLLTDPQAIQLYKETCPDMYAGMKILRIINFCFV